jgi:hypothetical protein
MVHDNMNFPSDQELAPVHVNCEGLAQWVKYFMKKYYYFLVPAFSRDIYEYYYGK